MWDNKDRGDYVLCGEGGKVFVEEGDSGTTLGSLGIYSSTEVWAVPVYNSAKRGSTPIEIKMMTKPLVTLCVAHVDLDDAVWMLKGYLHEHMLDFPRFQYTDGLIFEQKKLQNHRSLASYGIKSNSTILLFVKRHGMIM